MLKEGVSVWFLRRPVTSLVMVKISTVVMVFLDGTFWRSLMTCLNVNLCLARLCLVVLVVSDVLGSLLLW